MTPVIDQKQKVAGPIQREYGYDAFGNVSRISDGPDQTHYVYDLINRLKKAEGSIPEIFSFDPAGNLLQAGDSKQSNASVKGNRLYTQGDRRYTYDARGNLIEEHRGDGEIVTSFEYNFNNQLVKATRDGHTTTYTYDPLGRRISKTDAFGITRYLWVGNQMVQEQRNHLKKTYIFEPESFKPVAQVLDEKIYHYHLDHLGTPRELTDENGKVVWKVRYKTYGSVAVKEVEEVENNIRFQGQYFDEETGLHYNRFRYYNPNTGQFITQDPIGLLGGINNYRYAPNPFGLSCKESWRANAKKVFGIPFDNAKKAWKYGLGAAEIVASGALSGILEIGGGLVSIPFAIFKGVDEAVAVQERIASLAWTPKSEGAQAIIESVLAPMGEEVEKGIHAARMASEDKIGIGATAIVFGAVDATLQIGGLLTGTKAVQSAVRLGSKGKAKDAEDREDREDREDGGHKEDASEDVDDVPNNKLSSSIDGGFSPTGIDKFDQPFSLSPQFGKVSAGLERRGITLVPDKTRLDAGERAFVQLERDGSGILVYDPDTTPFIDILHESRHVAQIQRAQKSGLLGDKSIYGAKLKPLFERGAYEYELRLGQKFDFDSTYNQQLVNRINDYYTPKFESSLMRSQSRINLFNVIEPSLSPRLNRSLLQQSVNGGQ